MFKKVGDMLIVNSTKKSLSAAVRAESFGVCCSYKFVKSIDQTGEKTYEWRTFLAHNYNQQIVLEGNHLFEFAEELGEENTGIVELSPRVYVFGRFPMAMDYFKVCGKVIRFSIINQFPRVRAVFDSTDDAFKNYREIINNKPRLVKKRGDQIVPEPDVIFSDL